jgi:hypothetical protein
LKYKVNKILIIGIAIVLALSFFVAIIIFSSQDLVFASDIKSFVHDEVKEDSYKNLPKSKIDKPTSESIERLKEKTRSEKKIDNLQDKLLTKNSTVFQDRYLVRVLIAESEKIGADYRIVVGIMGKESGYCRANYKTYNCFGYLNGVQYSSFREAFDNLVPKVAAKVAPHNWDLMGLAYSYRPVDKKAWAKGVGSMAKQF